MAAGVEAEDADKARRFRDAALPHLDDVYTLARYLLRNAADADDAVQECYLRAFRHFESFQGPAIRPWLGRLCSQRDPFRRVRYLGADGGAATRGVLDPPRP